MQGNLILEDKTVYNGTSFGAEKSISGEVVFNTGMVGYVENLTDPSYRGQILILTYPLIGNYGVPSKNIKDGLIEKFESDKIQVSGIIISDYSHRYSHHDAVKSLGDWLKEEDIPGLYNIDTRALTIKLREQGVMLGKINITNNPPLLNPNSLNLVKEVSTKKPIIYGSGKTKILLIDTGVKFSIIRCLLKRNVEVIRVPWNFDPLQGEFDFDGILLPNGPGDPKMCKETILHIRNAMVEKKRIFGICLGNQILSLAAGANTYKLKFGHRSQNQPCIDIENEKCYITSQNHGFAVDQSSLPRDWTSWFKNANDDTNEGIKHKSGLFNSVQFHPEAAAGPLDTEFLFSQFVKKLK